MLPASCIDRLRTFILKPKPVTYSRHPHGRLLERSRSCPAASPAELLAGGCLAVGVSLGPRGWGSEPELLRVGSAPPAPQRKPGFVFVGSLVFPCVREVLRLLQRWHVAEDLRGLPFSSMQSSQIFFKYNALAAVSSPESNISLFIICVAQVQPSNWWRWQMLHRRVGSHPTIVPVLHGSDSTDFHGDIPNLNWHKGKEPMIFLRSRCPYTLSCMLV